eukprot:TRINITY_DN8219_c0_g1_i2.p1 TRINITY_DN8219_c0_g1~~TRINITY_DN8219_c0_g1_i2.p1  ORF type:complete len:760 (-),score=56.50 TRINITY_DN8219_c0_g1_i2:240-2519(-)
MGSFQLMLHSIHGTLAQGLEPLRIKELGYSDSAADRISSLLTTVSAVGELRRRTLKRSVEVHLSAGGCYVLNDRGEECLWLPLESSIVVHCECASTHSSQWFGSVAGLLAYSAPVAPQAFAWRRVSDLAPAARPEAAEHVWIFEVTSTFGFNSSSTIDGRTSVLQMAIEELGVRGAIRGDLVGLRPSSVPLGEGGYASVQKWQRDIRAESSGPAEVWIANQNISLAVKVSKPQTSSEQASKEEQVFNEASYLIAVQGHPNVARFFGLFCLMHDELGPSCVLIMQAHERGSLHSHIKSTGGFPIGRALNHLRGLLQALVHIHSFNIIHRDVKSDNILLDAGDRAVLIDFGIAVHSSQVARLARKCGTPGSIAPELLRRGECTVKGDMFAAGIVFYQSLSGVRPLDRNDKILTLRANAKAKISYDMECFRLCCSDVRGLLRKMLTASTQRRHTSASALDVASRLCNSPTAMQAEIIHIAEVHGNASMAQPVQAVAEARSESSVRRHRLPAPRARSLEPVQEDEQQASPASSEPHSSQHQSVRVPRSQEMAWADGECRSADVPPGRISECVAELPAAESRTHDWPTNMSRQRQSNICLLNGKASSYANAEPALQQHLPASSPLSCGTSSKKSSPDPVLAHSSDIYRSSSAAGWRHEKDAALVQSFPNDDAEMSGDAHVRHLLREHRRKLIRKNEQSPSISIVDSSKVHRLASKDRREDEDVASREMIQNYDEGLGDRSSMCSSMSAFSFETYKMEEWFEAVL